MNKAERYEMERLSKELDRPIEKLYEALECLPNANLHIFLKRDKRKGWDPLRHRAERKAEIEACVENGEIAVYTSGRDCDCVQYSDCSIQDYTGVFAFMRGEDESYRWADGPMSISYGKPSESEEFSESRDLALEAFENGHPHIVYT